MRRGSVMLTRSTVSSSAAGSMVTSERIQPAYSGLARIVSSVEGGGTGSPASSAASIQASPASSAPSSASSRVSPAEKQPGKSGMTTPYAESLVRGSIAMG